MFTICNSKSQINSFDLILNIFLLYYIIYIFHSFRWPSVYQPELVVLFVCFTFKSSNTSFTHAENKHIKGLSGGDEEGYSVNRL